jgi:1-aminocyclopropane-1-carboxylate deaminase/D-cysteine desulfhydrase-like pyridoxal-dependent ACC family enzyme
MTMTPEIHNLSAIAFIECFIELSRQLELLDVNDADIFIGSGGPTYAGLFLATCASGGGLRVHGVPARGLGRGAHQRVLDIATRAVGFLKADVLLDRTKISLLGDGGGVHGVVHPAALEAIRTTAQLEGLILDPIYTGYAMAEMIRWLKETPGESPVVFVHTGGVAALFAYERELTQLESTASSRDAEPSRIEIS